MCYGSASSKRRGRGCRSWRRRRRSQPPHQRNPPRLSPRWQPACGPPEPPLPCRAPRAGQVASAVSPARAAGDVTGAAGAATLGAPRPRPAPYGPGCPTRASARRS
eukprot:scaffold29537_cov125-Isochrysis_galbana.AAC.3